MPHDVAYTQTEFRRDTVQERVCANVLAQKNEDRKPKRDAEKMRRRTALHESVSNKTDAHEHATPCGFAISSISFKSDSCTLLKVRANPKTSIQRINVASEVYPSPEERSKDIRNRVLYLYLEERGKGTCESLLATFTPMSGVKVHAVAFSPFGSSDAKRCPPNRPSWPSTTTP